MTTSKRHKYGAQRTTVDNITFASKAEARRYAELKLLEKAGQIRGLVLQPKYPLYTYEQQAAGWKTQVVGHYVADFAYLNTRNEQVIEDVKGMRTPLFIWKKKHFELQSGQEITEVYTRRHSDPKPGANAKSAKRSKR